MKFISGKYTSGQLLADVRAVEDWITRQYDVHGQITDETLKKDMSRRLIDVSQGRNDCLFDDLDYPSVMVRLPETRLSELESSWGNNIHPAFIVNGQVVKVWLAKYQAMTVGSGASLRALSLRGKEPRASINFDTAREACANKGGGFHLITNAEWGFVLNWCRANSFWPRGNNSYGRDYSRTSEHGEAITRTGTQPLLTSTGTGPVTWSHDGTPFGVFDMNGNVWEWCTGFRLVDGEIQILVDNNAADSSKDLSASSSEYRAILPDGAIVDPGTAGTLKWDATGADGTGSIRLNTSITSQSDGSTSANVDWRSITAEAGVSVPALLHQLGIHPLASGYGVGRAYMRNVGERLPYRGGHRTGTSNAGVPAVVLSVPRSYSYANFGLRLACFES